MSKFSLYFVHIRWFYCGYILFIMYLIQQEENKPDGVVEELSNMLHVSGSKLAKIGPKYDKGLWNNNPVDQWTVKTWYMSLHVHTHSTSRLLTNKISFHLVADLLLEFGLNYTIVVINGSYRYYGFIHVIAVKIRWPSGAFPKASRAHDGNRSLCTLEWRWNRGYLAKHAEPSADPFSGVSRN